MSTALEEMRARVAAATAAAKAAELTPDEIELAALATEEREAKAAEWTSAATRIDTELTMRLAVAEARAAGRYLVGAVNVLRCFPVGTKMDAEVLPGRGCYCGSRPRRHFTPRGNRPKCSPTGHLCATLRLSGQRCLSMNEGAEGRRRRSTAVTLLGFFCRLSGAKVVIGASLQKPLRCPSEGRQRGRSIAHTARPCPRQRAAPRPARRLPGLSDMPPRLVATDDDIRSSGHRPEKCP
jgi:hypothetical protein